MASVVNGRLTAMIYPDQKIHELTREIGRLREVVRTQEAALAIAQKVCGNNNCNCPGAKKVKEAVQAVLST